MLNVLLSLIIATVVAPAVCIADTKVAGNPAKWQRIYPVKECMNFHLVYFKDGNHYYLTYPEDSGKYKNPYITVKSISDLSGIADVIANEVNKRCKLATLETSAEACNPLDNLDPEFIRLVQAAANAVGKNGDRCRELTRYMELHDQITGLDPKNPVSISNAANVGNAILKVFANSMDDQLIDHFEACGGKTQSHKFIENLLLVECHRNCIMPKPPGILSWPEMREVAARIGSRYKNSSILSIRDKKPEIEKDALIEITRVASLKQLRELIPSVDANKALGSLQSYQNLLKARDVADLKNYIKLVYTPDAAMEIAEKSLVGVVNENMLDKLPKEWSAKRKKEYINEILMPKAMAGFNECMDRPRKNINYGHVAAPQINLNFRNRIKSDFCKQFKNVCLQVEKPGCAETKVGINLMSMKPETSDAEVAKSCVLNGMSRVIEPIFGLTLDAQVDSFKKDVKLPPDLAVRFTESSWAQFQSCINTHPITRKQFTGKKVFNPIYKPDGTNADAFEKMSPEEFKKLYGDCSDRVEQKLTVDFVEVVFISNENVVENNNFGAKVDFHGTRYPAGAITYTQNTVKRNLEKCFDQQRPFNKNNPEFKPNPALCSPLMEVEVARSIISGKLRKMFDDKKMNDDKDAVNILTEFSICGHGAYQKTLKDVGNPKSNPQLVDSTDVKPYMERDKTFYRCVETALSKTAKIIGGKEFKSALAKQKKTLKNYTTLLGMENDVKEIVVSCFAEELRNVGSWPAFKNWNAADGIRNAEEKCGKAANKYAIPRIMLKETVSQVQQVHKDGFLPTPSDIHLVINQGAEDIRATLGLKVDQTLKGDPALLAIFGEGLEAFQQKYPSSTQEDYLSFFKKKVTQRVIQKVHGKLLDKIISGAQSRYGLDLSSLPSSLTSECVLDLYDNLTREAKPKDPTAKPLNLDDLTAQVVDGFWYLKRQPPPALKQQLDKIAGFCKNARAYTNVEDVKRTGLLDFVVKAQVHEKAIAAFKEIAQQGYEEDVKKYSGKEGYHIVRPFIEKKYSDMLTLIEEKLEDPMAFERLLFPNPSSPILSYAIEHTDEVTVEGSPANLKLNQLVMEQMFKDRSRQSFASRFSEIQIVNAVGMEGYGEAKVGIHASANKHKSISSTVVTVASGVLDRNWTIQKVHDRIFWYDLPDFARQRLIGSIYDHAITPVIRGESEDKIKTEKALLAQKISGHVDGWHDKGKVFKEVFTEEIEAQTQSEILKNHKGSAVSEALGRWFTWGN